MNLHKAMKLAYKSHKKQDREGAAPLPYLTHPIDVVNKLRYVGQVTDEAILAAGFLHDVVEESETTNEQIREELGDAIADLVAEVTREEPDPATRAKYSEQEWYDLRNRLLLEEIEKMSPAAKAVKLADRCSNLEGALVTREGTKLRRYVDQSREILKIVPRETNAALWDFIEAKIAEYDAGVERRG